MWSVRHKVQASLQLLHFVMTRYPPVGGGGVEEIEASRRNGGGKGMYGREGEVSEKKQETWALRPFVRMSRKHNSLY